MTKRNTGETRIPPALKQLAENSPPLPPERFRAATIVYLGALGETLSDFRKKGEGDLMEEVLQMLRAKIEQYIPLDPRGPGAYRQHVLILHQLVVEGYWHVKSLEPPQ